MSDEDALRDLVIGLVTSVDADTSRDGCLPPVWDLLTGAGLTSIGVDEEHGGSGGSLGDLVTVVRALGSHGIGCPLIEVATARWILGPTGEGQPGELPFFAAASFDGDDGAIRVPRVPWARHADSLVTFLGDRAVRIPIRDASVSVENGSDVSGDASDTLIVTSAATVVTVDEAPNRDAVFARHAVLQAAALVGATRGAYELTSEYVKTREQFGGPLVSIPAVAANLALIRTQVLLAEAALDNALAAFGATDQATVAAADAAGAAAAAARIVAAQAGSEAARLSHQLHGAMGVTKEYALRRLTTHLWAWRDAGVSQKAWSGLLGALGVEIGEPELWDRLTAAS